MVDPLIYRNPFIPAGARAEPMPSDGKMVKLVPCLKCRMNKVPYVFAPRNNVYSSRCLNCGTPHAFRNPEKSFKDIAREGTTQQLGPKKTYKGTEYVDATKTFETLRRKRELGQAYWRNPN